MSEECTAVIAAENPVLSGGVRGIDIPCAYDTLLNVDSKACKGLIRYGNFPASGS